MCLVWQTCVLSAIACLAIPGLALQTHHGFDCTKAFDLAWTGEPRLPDNTNGAESCTINGGLSTASGTQYCAVKGKLYDYFKHPNNYKKTDKDRALGMILLFAVATHEGSQKVPEGTLRERIAVGSHSSNMPALFMAHDKRAKAGSDDPSMLLAVMNTKFETRKAEKGTGSAEGQLLELIWKTGLHEEFGVRSLEAKMKFPKGNDWKRKGVDSWLPDVLQEFNKNTVENVAGVKVLPEPRQQYQWCYRHS